MSKFNCSNKFSILAIGRWQVKVISASWEPC